MLTSGQSWRSIQSYCGLQPRHDRKDRQTSGAKGCLGRLETGHQGCKVRLLYLLKENTARRLERPVQPFLSEVQFDTSPDGLFDHILYYDVSKALVLGMDH